MIGGLLAQHPEVAYFYQPFNRTEVHASQYEIWRTDEHHPRTEAFLAGMLAGRIDREYLGADLLEKHSSAAAPRLDGLNVVKETKIHFKSAWLRAHFPEIAVRGIWRDPRGILCSLLRNDFAATWYGERAFESIRHAIESEPELEVYRPFLRCPLDDLAKLALVVAARTHVFALSIAPDDWVVYEDVLEDPDAALGRLTNDFGLAPFDFGERVARDYNVVGAPPVRADLWRTFFTPTQLDALAEVLAPLGVVAPRSVGSEERLSA